MQSPECSPAGEPSPASWTGRSSAYLSPERICFPVRVNQSFPFPHLLYQLLLVTPGAQHELSLLLSWLEGTWRGLGKRLQQFRPKAGCASAGIIFM